MASVFTRVQQLVSRPGLVICYGIRMLVREARGPDGCYCRLWGNQSTGVLMAWVLLS